MHKKASLESYRPGSRNMNMSMDKPIVLINTEGTRGAQVKKCINGVKFGSPELSPELPLGFKARRMRLEHSRGHRNAIETIFAKML